MIVDRLDNAPLYLGLSKRIAAAFDYLRKTDFSRLPAGRRELDGANLYVLVDEYTTRLRETATWEAHRRYIDVQYLLSGVERIGYANLASLKVVKAYDEKADALFLSGDGDFLLMQPGMLMILWPQDAHMPGIAAPAPAQVKKIIVKVLV